VKKALFVSTDEVYGMLPLQSKRKFTEQTQYTPNVPYSATKAGGDLLCHAYWFTWQLPVVVTHCSNNYGPYQYPEKIIPYFTLLAQNDQPVPLYGDGKNVRDWIYVLDHCRALELALVHGEPGQIYNIGADSELSNRMLTKKILAILGKPASLISFVKDRPGHDRRYAIDATKVKKELGWQPRFQFEKMLESTVQWYIENPRWVQRVQEKTGVINAHIDLWRHAFTGKRGKA
jgi:dTDP-glucose 4,6-dehydratase